MYLYNNKIYKKIENSMCFYKEINPINWIFEEFVKICSFFKTTLLIHFNNFNLVDFIGSNLTNKDEKLKIFIDFTQKK